MATTYRLTYYPWITQHVSASDIRREIESFSAVLTEDLARSGVSATVEVLDPVSVPKQIELISGGGCQIALMNPLGYVFANRRSANAQAVAVAQRIIDGKVGNVYYAQVYTRVATAIRDVKQARGRSIAFGVRYSTSNFLIPALELKNRGIHPLTAFTRVEFLGGHDLVAKAVYEGRVDIGAGHDGAIADLSSQYGYGDADQKLSQLLRSAPIPSDRVAVNVPDEARQSVQAALVAASNREPAKTALARFWGNVQGLAPIDPQRYHPIARQQRVPIWVPGINRRCRAAARGAVCGS